MTNHQPSCEGTGMVTWSCRKQVRRVRLSRRYSGDWSVVRGAARCLSFLWRQYLDVRTHRPLQRLHAAYRQAGLHRAQRRTDRRGRDLRRARGRQMTPARSRCWHFAGIACRFTTACGVGRGIATLSPVRKYYSGRRCLFALDVPEQCCGLCLPTFVDRGSA
jgi:hypothetical protein